MNTRTVMRRRSLRQNPPSWATSAFSASADLNVAVHFVFNDMLPLLYFLRNSSRTEEVQVTPVTKDFEYKYTPIEFNILLRFVTLSPVYIRLGSVVYRNIRDQCAK